MPADLTAALFEPHLEGRFEVDGGPSLVLTAVDAVGPAPGPRLRRPFSLTFSGPADEPLQQGTRTLRHADLGAVVVFLVPLAPDRYEAVFG